ncbi:uncharacterized protein BJ212DRAFT_1229139, partial [Suillus subaureus]
QDLDKSITFHREALALQPAGCMDWIESFKNLVDGLSICFQHRSNVQDLDKSTVLCKEALA